MSSEKSGETVKILKTLQLRRIFEFKIVFNCYSSKMPKIWPKIRFITFIRFFEKPSPLGAFVFDLFAWSN